MINVGFKTRQAGSLFFSRYGEALLKALGFEECKRWYGPLFVRWYLTERKATISKEGI